MIRSSTPAVVDQARKIQQARLSAGCEFLSKLGSASSSRSPCLTLYDYHGKAVNPITQVRTVH
jgi:hypothetical protein